jgi:fructosamine-3-kinase
MHRETEEAIARAAGAQPRRFSALGGGCVAEVYRVDLEGGGAVVIKAGAAGSGLDVEGFMLDYLGRRSRLPVPPVLHAADDLLVMGWIEGGDRLDGAAEVHAAELLADLHGLAGPAFGFERDTLIGGLPQPNPWTERWVDFFRHHRLLHMAEEGRRAGRLPAALMRRIETLAGRLERWLAEPEWPGLVHGDVWGGNVLCRRGRVAGFVDPAVYYADPEIELAFATLFGTFGEPFFRRYGELRPLRPGFFEERRDLLNLYPLLVHVRLFGGSYVGGVEATLRRYGC